MSKHINQVKIDFPANRKDLIEAATGEVEPCIAVGGLAVELGLLRAPGSAVLRAAGPPHVASEGIKILARLVMLWRREQQLTVEQLAAKAGLEANEVLSLETEAGVAEPRVLHALSQALQVSYEKLMALAGHMVQSDARLSDAAIRFAARSEPMEKLSRPEQEALHEFVKMLVD